MRADQLESIYAKNRDEPMNPEVLIQGYGRLDLRTLEAKVVSMFKEIAEMGEKGNWENVEIGRASCRERV